MNYKIKTLVLKHWRFSQMHVEQIASAAQAGRAGTWKGDCTRHQGNLHSGYICEEPWDHAITWLWLPYLALHFLSEWCIWVWPWLHHELLLPSMCHWTFSRDSPLHATVTAKSLITARVKTSCRLHGTIARVKLEHFESLLHAVPPSALFH